MIKNILSQDEINKEIAKYEVNRPIVYNENPYEQLDPRKFEIMLYLIYKNKIIDKKLTNFDTISLMQGTKERGRDCILFNLGESMGLIQCKHTKVLERVDKVEVIKEIIKFAMYYYLDRSLIKDVKSFNYYFVTSYEFTESATLLFKNFKQVVDDPQLTSWIGQVKKDIKSFKDLEPNDNLINDIKFTLENIRVHEVTKIDLNEELSKYPTIKKMFFKIEQVSSLEDTKNLLERILSDHDILPIKDEDLNKLNQIIRATSSEKKTFSGSLLFLGYHKDLLSAVNQKEFAEIYLQLVRAKSKFDILLLQTLTNEIINLTNLKLSKDTSISDFIKQSAIGIVQPRITKYFVDSIYGEEISKQIFKEELDDNKTVKKQKELLINKGLKVISGDYSDYILNKEIEDYYINNAKSIFQGLKSKEEMEELFDKEIVLLKPILEEIISELYNLIPKNGTIIINDLLNSNQEDVQKFLGNQ